MLLGHKIFAVMHTKWFTPFPPQLPYGAELDGVGNWGAGSNSFCSPYLLVAAAAAVLCVVVVVESILWSVAVVYLGSISLERPRVDWQLAAAGRKA